MAAATTLQPLPSTAEHLSDDMLSNQPSGLRNVGIDHERIKTVGDHLLPISNFLIEQMCAVLKDLGYDKDAINKVVNRVTANIVEADDVFDDCLTDSDELSFWFSDELLNKERLRKKNIHLNSNEPVFLLDVPLETGLSTLQLQRIKDNIHVMLVSRGIRPVRMYVRLNRSAEKSCFGFCLLNVVNTDIGGPSMIQLLDTAFHSESWKESLLLKAGYDGYNLIWQDQMSAIRDQKETSVAASSAPAVHEHPEDLPKTKSVDVKAESKESNTFQLPINDSIPKPSEEVTASSLPPQYKDVNSVPDDSDHDEPEKEEHPAMKELREQEAARAAVRHPTWVREHESQGLLDIITTQSAGVENEPISIISQPSGDASEDFEVVDRP